MNWIDNRLRVKPTEFDKYVLCYCPKWNDSGYQVAKFNGKKCDYGDAPNDNFD